MSPESYGALSLALAHLETAETLPWFMGRRNGPRFQRQRSEAQKGKHRRKAQKLMRRFTILAARPMEAR